MPYGKPPRQLERGRSNRFLAALPPHDFALLTPHLRTVTLERGTILHDAADEIERVYFPHRGMVSVVAVMQSGAAVETATIGRAGVIGASAGLGVKYSFARAIVQLPGTAAWLSPPNFMPLPTGVRPFAISSCIIVVCCSRKSSNRSRAMCCIRWRPGFAAGCCKLTIAWTAMTSR